MTAESSTWFRVSMSRLQRMASFLDPDPRRRRERRARHRRAAVPRGDGMPGPQAALRGTPRRRRARREDPMRVSADLALALVALACLLLCGAVLIAPGLVFG